MLTNTESLERIAQSIDLIAMNLNISYDHEDTKCITLMNLAQSLRSFSQSPEDASHLSHCLNQVLMAFGGDTEGPLLLVLDSLQEILSDYARPSFRNAA